MSKCYDLVSAKIEVCSYRVRDCQQIVASCTQIRRPSTSQQRYNVLEMVRWHGNWGPAQNTNTTHKSSCLCHPVWTQPIDQISLSLENTHNDIYINIFFRHNFKFLTMIFQIVDIRNMPMTCENRLRYLLLLLTVSKQLTSLFDRPHQRTLLHGAFLWQQCKLLNISQARKIRKAVFKIVLIYLFLITL